MYTLPGRAFNDIPVIETERFRLRASHAGDFDRMYEMWQDPEYYRHIGNKPRSTGEVWGSLQKCAGSWALFGLGFWTIADPETDAYMGECGLMLSRRAEIEPALPMIPELGWGIRREYWGQGIVSAAMLAAMHWAREQDPNMPYQCIINQGHTASEAIAKKLGMTVQRTVAFGGNADDLINVWASANAPA